MNTKVSRILFLLVCSYTLCSSATAGVRVGVRAGINRCVLDGLTGPGSHIGIDIGYCVGPSFAVSFAPQIKWTNYDAMRWPGTDYEYRNLFLPLVFSVHPLQTNSVSPYLGIGPAVNVQLRGRAISNWTFMRYDIEPLETDLYLTGVLGFDVELGRFSFRPELFFNQNMTGNFPDALESDAAIYDFGLAICIQYIL